MNTIQELITPEKATEYLQTSIGNRPVSKVYVNTYVNAIQRGEWKNNGVPIIFDYQGHLIDGHHRLNAIVKSNTPVMMSVTRGAEEGSFTTIDCGRSRNLGQIIAMKGVKNYNAVAAIVRGSQILKKHKRFWENNTDRTTYGKRQNWDYYDVYEKDEENFIETAQMACEFHRQCNIIKASWIGSLIYHLTLVLKHPMENVSYFFKELCSYKTSDNTTINALREFLLRKKTANIELPADELFALIAKTWNNYYQNVTTKIVRFVKDKEAYPILLEYKS